MGWLTSLVKTGSRLVKPAISVAKTVPGIGTAATVLGAAGAVVPFLGNSKAPALPALPGMPAMPSTVGRRGIFQNDPNIAAQMQGFAISKANLKVCYRAPKGFVVLRDEKGDPYGFPKEFAKQMGLWRPSRKPPISAGDWHSLQRANKVVNKLKTMEKMARKVANFGSRPRQQKQIIIEQPGRRVVGRKVA